MAQLAGDRHYDGRAATHQQLQQVAQPWRVWRQCPRCWGRMSGPLQGVVATRLLEDYLHDALCTACQYELAQLQPQPPQQRAPRRRRRQER
jgi:hypothetical protein